MGMPNKGTVGGMAPNPHALVVPDSPRSNILEVQELDVFFRVFLAPEPVACPLFCACTCGVRDSNQNSRNAGGLCGHDARIPDMNFVASLRDSPRTRLRW